MAKRTPGPFDYFEVTGASIVAAAETPDHHVRSLAGLADDLDLDGRRAKAATEGDISGLVATNPHSAARVARSLAQKGAFAAACLRTFAAHVDVFDADVARLNRLVAEASDLPDIGKLLLQPLGGVTATRNAKYQELLPRYRKDQASLDDAADRVARWLKSGPTDELLHVLVRSGMMPLEAASAFPTLELNAADLYLALAAKAAEGLIPRSVLIQGPDAIDAYLTTHHDIAAALVRRMGDSTADGSATSMVQLLVTPALVTGASGISDLISQTTSAERRRIALLLPSHFGNNPDAPFDMRAQANRVRISAQIHEDEVRMAQLRKTLGSNQLLDNEYRDVLSDEFDRLSKRAGLYQDLLTGDVARDKDGRQPDHRQVVYFDPDGDGAIAEVHGILDPRTKNVGVYVPGTGHGLDDWNDSVDRSKGFLRNSSGLAMITWIGGDLPDSVRIAIGTSYAHDAAPLLSEFSNQVRTEMDRAGTAGAKVTYLGHSYGGTIVGEAEHIGLDADRVLMVEGAGMGPSVDSVSDLAERGRDVPHYSMTAPGDGIEISQGSGRHGADPDSFGDTVRLQTGRTREGEPIEGISSHSDVFKIRSDAWRNMLNVLNGGNVTRWHEDDAVVIETAGIKMVPNLDSAGTVKVK